MREMIKILTILLVLFFANNTVLFSQNVGYMGKKLSVELNSSSGIYNINNNPQIDGEKTPQFKLNFHPELVLAYSIGRRVDFGARIGYDRVKLNVENVLIYNALGNVLYSQIPSNGFDSYYNENYFNLIEPEQIANVYNVDLFFRFYTRRYIAPVGFFHQVSLGLHYISTKEKEIDGYLSSDELDGFRRNNFLNNPGVAVLNYENETMKKFSLAYYLGNKHVFDNGIYTSVGIEVRITKFGDLFKELVPFPYDEFDDDRKNYETAINDLTHDHIYRAQTLEFKFGVGKIF